MSVDVNGLNKKLMSHIATNWENDMIAEPEDKVQEFIRENYPNYELKLLSGLRQRDIQDVWETIKESRIIIMQPSLLDKEQVQKMLLNISHGIHTSLNGAYRLVEVRDFIFLSMNPWEDLLFIKECGKGLRDTHSEYSLIKLLRNCEVHFYGFAGEHYEMVRGGNGTSHYPSDIEAIRHK
jgi:hypothetical protein